MREYSGDILECSLTYEYDLRLFGRSLGAYRTKTLTCKSGSKFVLFTNHINMTLFLR